MQLHVFDDPATLGRVAATVAAEIIADSIAARGRARIIAATGASQFQFLSALVERRELPWAASVSSRLAARDSSAADNCTSARSIGSVLAVSPAHFGPRQARQGPVRQFSARDRRR